MKHQIQLIFIGLISFIAFWEHLIRGIVASGAYGNSTSYGVALYNLSVVTVLFIFMSGNFDKITRNYEQYKKDSEKEKVGRRQQEATESMRAMLDRAKLTHAEPNSEFDNDVERAKEIIKKEGVASTSLLKTHMQIGYGRAVRIIERLEDKGLVGPSDGINPRKVNLKEGFDDVLVSRAIEEIQKANKASLGLLTRRLTIGYGQAEAILNHLADIGFITRYNGKEPSKIIKRDSDKNGVKDE